MTGNGILRQTIVAEWRALRSDRWLFALTVWLPLLVCITLWWIFSASLPRELPVVVVDLDETSLSRRLIRYVDASPALTVADRQESVRSAKRAIAKGSAYAIIVIPPNMARDIRLGKAPGVTTFFNAQYLLVARAIRSSLFEIESTLAAELDTARAFEQQPTLSAAVAAALPLRSQLTPLYNANLNYAQFLLPGLVAAVIQVLACCTAVLSHGRDLTEIAGQSPAATDTAIRLLGKMLPYTVAFVAILLAVLTTFVGALDWPFHGHIMALLPVAILFVAACQILGLFFLTLTFDTVRSLSVAGAFSAPAFAFLGVTFPVSDMSGFAAVWRELMPAAHFLDAYVAYGAYSSGAGGLFRPSLLLLSYLSLIAFILYRLRTRAEPSGANVHPAA